MILIYATKAIKGHKVCLYQMLLRINLGNMINITIKTKTTCFLCLHYYR